MHRSYGKFRGLANLVSNTSSRPNSHNPCQHFIDSTITIQISTYLECPLSFPTGLTSGGSSASVKRVKLSGTSHKNTLPSSDADAMISSLKGLQSVSSTAAVCPRNRGNCSGSLPFSSSGITANAPPPLASQLTATYFGLALTMFESQAFLLIRRLS